jgi:hypothetical protein
MKWIIMMFGDQATMVESRSEDWIRSMIRFMQDLDDELRASDELVASVGLDDATLATTVRFVDGTPVSTDGPFAESKESLAGYYIVEASEDRAIEIASRIVAFIEGPIEVRRVAEGPPEEYTS